MLEVIRCPCHGAVTEAQGERGKQEVKCGHMSKNMCAAQWRETKFLIYS